MHHLNQKKQMAYLNTLNAVERPFAPLFMSLFCVCILVSACAMYIPALYAAGQNDYQTARIFFYCATLLIVIILFIFLAIGRYATFENDKIYHNVVTALIGVFVVLPVFLAVPILFIAPDVPFSSVYFDMVASLTTTGASTLKERADITKAVHIWRVVVGWGGGGLIWLMAAALLTPLTLQNAKTPQRKQNIVATRAISGRLFIRTARHVLPIYIIITLLLWVLLLLFSNLSAIFALCYAMSTLATSAILPVTITPNINQWWVEVIVFVFLICAISRSVSTPNRNVTYWLRSIYYDSEVRTAVCLIVIIASVMTLYPILSGEFTLQFLFQNLQKLWAHIFNAVSFLTTTGFQSQYTHTQIISVEPTSTGTDVWRMPILVLAGLCLVGGGIATTAGGIKLIRFHALCKHSFAELEKLVYPSLAVIASTDKQYPLLNQSIFAIWTCLMVFLVTLLLAIVALALAGIKFDHAALFAIAALSGTGPLPEFPPYHLRYDDLLPVHHIILATVMVLGRVETLIILAIFSPTLIKKP